VTGYTAPFTSPARFASPAQSGSALAQLTELGYDAELARRALELSGERVDVAAELMIGGDVSRGGVRALGRGEGQLNKAVALSECPTGTLPFILKMVMQSPQLFQAMRGGNNVALCILMGGRDLTVLMNEQMVQEAAVRAGMRRRYQPYDEETRGNVSAGQGNVK
jgi:hypothetical protein